MGNSETGQVSQDAAKIYESVYLPALFHEWCPLAIRAANVKAGDSVVDVACGTGVLAIAISEHVGPEGRTIGVDINEEMLLIARSKPSYVEWLNAPAEVLPFTDDYFDCVVSQFGLMYFQNREAAIREMMRVLKPGGTMAVTVWDKLDNNPGFAAEEHLWRKVFGKEEDDVPSGLGDKEVLENLFRTSGISDAQVNTYEGTARFSSIESWIHAGVKGWTEDDTLNDDELRLLLETAEKEFTDFRTIKGTVTFPTSAHIVNAKK
jgi:SAM-dependent methyltransferase